MQRDLVGEARSPRPAAPTPRRRRSRPAAGSGWRGRSRRSRRRPSRSGRSARRAPASAGRASFRPARSRRPRRRRSSGSTWSAGSGRPAGTTAPVPALMSSRSRSMSNVSCLSLPPNVTSSACPPGTNALRPCSAAAVGVLRVVHRAAAVDRRGRPGAGVIRTSSTTWSVSLLLRVQRSTTRVFRPDPVDELLVHRARASARIVSTESMSVTLVTVGPATCGTRDE